MRTGKPLLTCGLLMGASMVVQARHPAHLSCPRWPQANASEASPRESAGSNVLARSLNDAPVLWPSPAPGAGRYVGHFNDPNRQWDYVVPPRPTLAIQQPGSGGATTCTEDLPRRAWRLSTLPAYGSGLPTREAQRPLASNGQ